MLFNKYSNTQKNIERVERAWQPQVKLPTTRPAPSAAGNTATPTLDSDMTCAGRFAQTSDQNQLNNERLDDIAFDNHLMDSVYRKDTGSQRQVKIVAARCHILS